MTVDLSEFHNISKNKLCIVARFVDTLSDADAEKFVAALDEATITSSDILRWCAKRDSAFRLNALYLHRRAECSCHRT